METKSKILLIQSLLAICIIVYWYFYKVVFNLPLVLEWIVVLIFLILPYILLFIYNYIKNFKRKYCILSDVIIHKYISLDKIVHKRFIEIQSLKDNKELNFPVSFVWEWTDDLKYKPKITYVINNWEKHIVEKIYRCENEIRSTFDVPLTISKDILKKCKKNEIFYLDITYELDDNKQNWDCDYIKFKKQKHEKSWILVLLIDFSNIIDKISEVNFIQKDKNNKVKSSKRISIYENLVCCTVNNLKMNNKYKINWKINR